MNKKKYYFDILNPQEEIPKEENKSDAMLEQLGKEASKQRYMFINCGLLALVMIFGGLMLFFLRDNDYSQYNDETNEMSVARIKSGEYTENFETQLYGNLSYADEIGSVNNFFQHLYGFGNESKKQEQNDDTNAFDDDSAQEIVTQATEPEVTHNVVTWGTDGVPDDDSSTADTKKTEVTTTTPRKVTNEMTTTTDEDGNAVTTTRVATTVTTTTHNEPPQVTTVTTTTPLEPEDETVSEADE